MMMNERLSWAVGLALCCATTTTLGAEPVNSVAGKPAPVNAVVVTATRMSQPLFEAPAAIDAIDGQSLSEHKLRVNLSESLGRVPGLVVQNRQNYAQDLQVSSRGFGARASFGVRGVRLIQDGIPLTMPDGQGQTGLFDLDGAARVEVLRGPFAALYGNSSGGVIQIVSENRVDEPSFELNTTYGEDGFRRYGSQFGAKLGSVQLTGNLSRFDTDGFREHSAARRDLANVRVRIAEDERSSFTAIFNALDQPETQDPLGLTRAQLEEDPTQAGTNAIALNTRKSIRHVQGGASYERTLSDQNRIRVMGYYGDRDLTQYLANPSTALTGSGGVVDLARKFGGGAVQWENEGQFIGAPYELTVGVEYDRMEEQRLGFVNAGGLRGDLRRDEDDTVYSSNQFFIAQWRPLDRWMFSGGLRHSDVRFEVEDNFIVGPNPDDSGKLRYESTQPVFGVLFEATPNINLFASAGRAFETPTFSELAYRPDGSPGLNFDLDAAISTNYEAGIKTLWGDHARIVATLFRSDTEDDIVTGPPPFPGRNTFVNAAETRREGAELSAQYTMTNGLDFGFAYTYTRARFEDFVNFEGEDLSGAHLPGVPGQSLYADVAWRHVPSGFLTGLEARWNDKVYVNDQNSDFADSYTTLNWHAGLRRPMGDWELNGFLRVDNVTDEDYVGSVVVNGAGDRFFEPAPGRTFYVGVTAGF
jgi:iron complex outermembrane receptor protein